MIISNDVENSLYKSQLPLKILKNNNKGAVLHTCSPSFWRSWYRRDWKEKTQGFKASLGNVVRPQPQTNKLTN